MPRRFPPKPRPQLAPLRTRLLEALPGALLLGAFVGGLVSLPASATAGVVTMLCVSVLFLVALVSPEPPKSNVGAPAGHVLCALCTDDWVPDDGPPYRCPGCGGVMSKRQVCEARFAGSE